MATNVGLTYFYANNFLTVDEEKYETQELYTEGLMNSFGAFLVFFYQIFFLQIFLVGVDFKSYISSFINLSRYQKTNYKMILFNNCLIMRKIKEFPFLRKI